MGLNSCVLILNDALNEIADDKNFGKKLYDAIQGPHRPVTVNSGSGNVAQVLSTYHADDLVAVVVGGNRGDILGWAGNSSLSTKKEEDVKKMLYNIADQNGLKIYFKK